MKLKNIFKIFIFIVLAFVISGCEGKETKYTLTQDGNFLVYTTDIEAIEKTSFTIGTELIIRVKEDVIEEGYMIDKVYVNGEGRDPAYQYKIKMNSNISLMVTFKEIPKGTARVSIVGHELEISPHSPDNVYEIGSKITLKAPKYFKFRSLNINGEPVPINETTYELTVEKATKIIVNSDSLEATHYKVNIVSPGNRPVTILQPTQDSYYPKDSKITIKAPNNYHFEGVVRVNTIDLPINGETATITVDNHMTLVFSDSNLFLNSFSINLLNDDLVLLGNPNQTLYAHGSTVMLKAISNNGLDVIKRLNINGKWTDEINSAIKEIEITENLTIDAEFQRYTGEYELLEGITTEFYQVTSKDVILSPSLDIHVFLRNNNLIFQKAGNFKVRVDNGSNMRYLEFNIKYDLEDISIYQNGFGFIDRNELIYVGNANDFSIQLEGVALLLSLENPEETIKSTFVVNSNEVSNLNYSLEENGLDVTSRYLEVVNGLRFSPDALNKEFNLIIRSEDGIEVIQPIKVIEGKNIYTVEDLTIDTTIILQKNLTLTESINVNLPIKVIGNYHTILFDTIDSNLFVVNEGSLEIVNTILKSKGIYSNTMIKATNSLIKLNNVVVENGVVGVELEGGNLISINTKYQNMLESNVVLKNNKEAVTPIILNIALENNIFQKTTYESIKIIDHVQEQPYAHMNDIVAKNKFNNVKEYIELTPEVEDQLLFLEAIDTTLVNRELQQYNFAFVLHTESGTRDNPNEEPKAEEPSKEIIE